MNEKYKNLIFSLAGALIVTFLCGVGIFDRPDKWVQDALFQTPYAVPGDIVIVGIDDNDLRNFGPYNTWDRSIMASALEQLAIDPNNRPAVVAIDCVYTGYTNEESDARLVEAAKKLGNVVTAGSAVLGTTRTFGPRSVLYDDYAVINYDAPYDELKAVTTTGHINVMYDTDGVLRHSALYLEPYGERVYSFAYEAARLYAQQNGHVIKEPPLDSRGQFFVSYSAEPYGFYEDITLGKLIRGEVSPEYFAGKVVLIGPYATGITDSYITPIEHADMMYGVEFHANVIQCLLDGNYKEEVPDYIQLSVMGLVCLVFFYFCNDKRLLIAVPLLVVFEALSIGGSLLLYHSGLITHALWLPAGIFLLFVVAVATNYIRAAIARQNVTKTFERYVAPNIVNEILKEGTDSLRLGGKLCNIAVLFVDIRGFTTMSERLSPEEVVHILNQYLSMTSACIENNKGTLDKFVGDATMAFWGAPLPEEDPVYLAAKTALDIVEGAKALSAKLKAEINEELNVGVGVHYGPAVVGNMGSEKRMDYTAIGDTVNTAARLEANAPGGTVYISRSVAKELEGRMRFTSLGDSIKLKGKAEGFEVLRLIGKEE